MVLQDELVKVQLVMHEVIEFLQIHLMQQLEQFEKIEVLDELVVQEFEVLDEFDELLHNEYLVISYIM